MASENRRAGLNTWKNTLNLAFRSRIYFTTSKRFLLLKDSKPSQQGENKSSPWDEEHEKARPPFFFFFQRIATGTTRVVSAQRINTWLSSAYPWTGFGCWSSQLTTVHKGTYPLMPWLWSSTNTLPSWAWLPAEESFLRPPDLVKWNTIDPVIPHLLHQLK